VIGRERVAAISRLIGIEQTATPTELQTKVTAHAGAVYKKGDFIGKTYEVFGVLGLGGFSVVYLVYSHETETAYALKTLRDQFLEDQETREQFRKEAKVWVDLERHPYVVTANFIDELAGRLYIGMEYIAPNEDGLNSLEGYLHHQPPDLTQSLRWGIQFCQGMEYAFSRGIRCHRDVKPGNIMITTDKIVKITDFGFADVIDVSRAKGGFDFLSRRRRGVTDHSGFGTPMYMPPEQFQNAARCDVRSDIYSFGVVLYQLASHGRLPFDAQLRSKGIENDPLLIWREMHRMHTEAVVAPLASPLFPVIQRCLQKEPSRRYQTFKDLRVDLDALLRRQTGEVVVPQKTRELEAWELYNKVIELEPGNADAWNNKGVCLRKQGRLQEALACYEQSIRARRHNASAWSNKGNILYTMGRYTEAIVSLNKAISIDPLNESAWLNKALVEERLGLRQEAATSFQKFIDLKPVEYSAHVEYARKRLAELQGKARPRKR
jgi:serine/threonine protein kinase